MNSSLSVRPASNWDEVRKTTRLAGSAFDGRNAEWFAGRVIDVPALPRENTLLGEVDGNLVCALQLYDRQLSFDDQFLWGAGIGNVCTDPAHQGQGYGRELLETAREFIDSKGYAFSLLHGPPGFYGQFGWISIPYSELTLESATDEIGGSPENFRPIATNSDVDTLSELYRNSVSNVSFLNRPSVLWRDWILEEKTSILDGYRVEIFEEGNRPEGYMVREVEGDRARCLEAAYTGSLPENFYRSCWDRLVRLDSGTISWRPTRRDILPVGSCGVSENQNETIMVSVHEGFESDSEDPNNDASQQLVEDLLEKGWYWSPLDAF
jgi:predicted acetyltransferase